MKNEILDEIANDLFAEDEQELEIWAIQDKRNDNKARKLADRLGKEAMLHRLTIDNDGVKLLWDWKIPKKYSQGKKIKYDGKTFDIIESVNLAHKSGPGSSSSQGRESK